MFEDDARTSTGVGAWPASRAAGWGTVAAAPRTTTVDVPAIRGWQSSLLDLDEELTDAERIDQIRALEELKCAAAAAQAQLTADFDGSQRAEQAAAGVKPEHQGRGVALQVGLARRESHHRGKQDLALARVVPDEMPSTWTAFRAGLISEWRVKVLARETACLSRADRGAVDQILAGDPFALAGMGDGELEREAKKLAYRMDPDAFVERRRRAEADRRVTIRPAPDVMSNLSALLPVAHGVAVHAVLTRHADSLRTSGDGRTKGQIMADTLVQQVMRLASPVGSRGNPHDAADTPENPAATRAGRDEASGEQREGSGPLVPVTVNVVISDLALLADSSDPAHLEGHGPIPAEVARQLIGQAEAAGKATIRRLYARPGTGELVEMEARSRTFPRALARFLRLRDQACRTPWCDAPIRHADHVEAAVGGGATSATNGQGLCQACNLAKQAFGWQARPRPGPRHTVETRTPTGHRYWSMAPDQPGSSRGVSRLEGYLADLRLAS